MPKITRKRTRYSGEDGASISTDMRVDSGGCRYVRVRAKKKTRKGASPSYISLDLCVDCGVVHMKNRPGFIVTGSDADRNRHALVRIRHILEAGYNLGSDRKGVRDVLGVTYHKAAQEALDVIESVLRSKPS